MTEQSDSALRCPTCSSTHLVRQGKAQSGRQRHTCRSCGRRTTNPIDSAPTPKFLQDLPDGEKFVITCAQNATPVFKPFWQSLLNYCQEEGAHLVCVPIRYKNPTSQQEAKKHTEDFEWWANEVVPYLYSTRGEIHDKLTLLGDLRINPTATRPLSGLDSITGPNSGIVPHPRAELKTIATPHHDLPKIMATTGAVTEADYSDTKAGAKAEFHHVFGALIVEKDGERFHLRRINANKDGSFIDLGTYYDQNKFQKADRTEALVLGDIHVGFTDPQVVDATFFQADSIINRLQPKRLVLHDAIDFSSRTHHAVGDPFQEIAKHRSGKNSVLKEMRDFCDFMQNIDAVCPPDVEYIFPASNHPEAMAKWVKRADWRDDPENAELYLEVALEMAKASKWTENGPHTIDPFHYLAWKLLPTEIYDKCTFLEPQESYGVKDVEIGQHGHYGPNGARGTVNNLSKLGTKIIIGHVHNCSEVDGAISAGTSTRLFMGYNPSPSNWLQSHVSLDAYGKRQIINIIDGKYRR